MTGRLFAASQPVWRPHRPRNLGWHFQTFRGLLGTKAAAKVPDALAQADEQTERSRRAVRDLVGDCRVWHAWPRCSRGRQAFTHGLAMLLATRWRTMQNGSSGCSASFASCLFVDSKAATSRPARLTLLAEGWVRKSSDDTLGHSGVGTLATARSALLVPQGCRCPAVTPYLKGWWRENAYDHKYIPARMWTGCANGVGLTRLLATD